MFSDLCQPGVILISCHGSLSWHRKESHRIRRWLEVKKMTGQRPVAKFKAGQISAALWENEVSAKNGGTATMLKATLQRRYRDSDGNWKSSGSFSRNEIPLAIYCLQKSFEHMIEGQKDDSVEEETVI
jgi:hypothetical protein